MKISLSADGKCKYFCSLPNGQVVIGVGRQRLCDKPHPTSPSFFVPCFYFSKTPSWVHCTASMIVSEKELLESLPKTCVFVGGWKFPYKEQFIQAVEEGIEQISSGHLKKIVPYTYAISSSPYSEEAFLSLTRHALFRKKQGEALIGYCTPQGSALYITPEILLSLQEDCLRTVSLAGTISASEKESLLYEEKMLDEQELVTSAIIRALSPFGAVHAQSKEVVQRGLLKHLQTSITCILSSTPCISTLVEALHPTPALGGVPKGEAIKLLKKKFPQDASRMFGAPFGVRLPTANNTHIYVAIRGIQRELGLWKMGIGCGVVQGSIPEQEWKEVQIKFRNLLHKVGIDHAS